MTRSPLLAILFITVLVFGVAHLLAIHFSLYWRFPPIDIPMHILGGVVVAFSILVSPSLGVKIPKEYFSRFRVLVMVFLVGLAWEVFEVWAGVPLFQHYFYLDSVKDLIMDIVGGAVGFAVATRLNELEYV